MQITTQTKLEEIAIKIDAHGKAAIENILTVGKLLCDARVELPSDNEFGAWRENRLSWLSQKMAANWMNVYKNNGEMLVGNNFRPTVFYQLTAPEVPESAREEAAEHDKLTVKQSKALVQAHKELEELKAENLRLKKDGTPAPANTKNLLSEIKELLDKQLIMPAMALNISTMDEKGQRAWLSMHVRKNSLENQLREKSQKIKDLESRPEPEPKIIEKEVIPLDVQEKLKKAETALSDLKKAENSAKNIRSDFNAVSDEKHKLEFEISELKKQLKVNDPDNIDKAFARDLQEIHDILKSKLIRLNEQQIQHGNPMLTAMGVIENTISALEAFSERVNGIGTITV